MAIRNLQVFIIHAGIFNGFKIKKRDLGGQLVKGTIYNIALK
jgi:hypothetical protein